jgi:hypothetical protein
MGVPRPLSAIRGTHGARAAFGVGGAGAVGGVGIGAGDASIATATPQAFTVASLPLELNGFGVDTHPGVVHCTPAHIHQVGAASRLRGFQH